MHEPEEWEPDLFANIGSLKEWMVLVGQCRACGRRGGCKLLARKLPR
jgi:hypothetical protein